MAEAVELRPVGPEDVEALIDLKAAVAAEGRWLGTEVPVDRDRERAVLSARMTESAAVALIASVEGRPVGLVDLAVAPYGVADLGMFVAEGWRGRGIGRALLAAALDWAREAGAAKVALQLWPHNRRARRLYESAGFVQEGYLRRHYPRRNGERWDAVVMGLLLEDESP